MLLLSRNGLLPSGGWIYAKGRMIRSKKKEPTWKTFRFFPVCRILFLFSENGLTLWQIWCNFIVLKVLISSFDILKADFRSFQRSVGKAGGALCYYEHAESSKVLQFNFLSGSRFFSRLVRQVISVPFVVWINKTAAPQRLFCLMKVSLRGFYWCTFRCLAGLANKNCVISKAKTLRPVKGKQKMKKSNIQSTEENKHV